MASGMTRREINLVSTRAHRRELAIGVLLAGATVAALAVSLAPSPAAAGPVAASPRTAASVATYPRNWAMPTHLTRACPVYENYPKPGVSTRRAWHLPAGAAVKVRYNVNGGTSYRDPETRRMIVTGWALIQDRHRAEHKPKMNPHYGFIRRSCLAAQLPLPPLTGIGGNRLPRHVHFNPIGSGRKVATLTVTGNATLRDAPRAFPIGNVRSRHHDTFVIGTRHCVVATWGTFVHGYAPAARRWGYVEASHLRGCRLSKH